MKKCIVTDNARFWYRPIYKLARSDSDSFGNYWDILEENLK